MYNIINLLLCKKKKKKKKKKIKQKFIIMVDALSIKSYQFMKKMKMMKYT